MNDHLKYRVWNPKAKSWDDGVWMYQSGQLDHDTMLQCDLDKCVVQRFTGLQDKSGIDIYEGDVVKYEFDGNVFIELISYQHVGFHITTFNDDSSCSLGGMHILCEVVGNIFENPELLE